MDQRLEKNYKKKILSYVQKMCLELILSKRTVEIIVFAGRKHEKEYRREIIADRKSWKYR